MYGYSKFSSCVEGGVCGFLNAVHGICLAKRKQNNVAADRFHFRDTFCIAGMIDFHTTDVQNEASPVVFPGMKFSFYDIVHRNGFNFESVNRDLVARTDCNQIAVSFRCNCIFAAFRTNNAGILSGNHA